MPKFKDDVLALDITEIPQPLEESPPNIRGLRLGRRENADSSDLHRWLRLRDERRCEHACTHGLEKPTAVHYSITWSARSSSAGGIVNPSALAVLRLITSSNLVGCSTGRSAGLAPLRILST